MAKYRVKLLREDSFLIEVDAPDEQTAVDRAFGQAPSLGSVESGWGQPWSVSASEWDDVEGFHGEHYEPEHHGQTAEMIGD